MSHNRLLCCVLPLSDIFRIPHGRRYLADVSSLPLRPAHSKQRLAADRLPFDDNPETERLRRFDLACGRGLARSLNSLLKLRRATERVDCPSSVLPDPLSAAGDTLESIATPNETNEPTADQETVTNEPTDACEIVTNEPTLAADVGLESPTYMNATEQNATIEPTLSTPSGGRRVGEMYLARGKRDILVPLVL
jgi:hypothetical protein